MQSSIPFLSPSEAAKRLGVSSKALRLYEQRGLLTPHRSEAGWRAYGPEAMGRLTDIVALRALGLSLAQVGRVLAGEPAELEAALAAHQGALEDKLAQLAGAIERVRTLRADLAQGKTPEEGQLRRLLAEAQSVDVAFDLPWPWGGERFELNDIAPITYIVGPLGSGKTRLAKRLSEMLPGGVFIGPERLDEDGAAAERQLSDDAALKARVERTMAWLVEDGATASPALTALLAGLEAEDTPFIVVDMVEDGLDQASQEALIAHLRGRGTDGRRLFLMTRSSAILDLAAVTSAEAILFCPANHSVPQLVRPLPGAPGYEAVASCLASPEVRARTKGVVAYRPEVA